MFPQTTKLLTNNQTHIHTGVVYNKFVSQRFGKLSVIDESGHAIEILAFGQQVKQVSQVNVSFLKPKPIEITNLAIDTPNNDYPCINSKGLVLKLGRLSKINPLPDQELDVANTYQNICDQVNNTTLMLVHKVHTFMAHVIKIQALRNRIVFHLDCIIPMSSEAEERIAAVQLQYSLWLTEKIKFKKGDCIVVHKAISSTKDGTNYITGGFIFKINKRTPFYKRYAKLQASEIIDWIGKSKDLPYVKQEKYALVEIVEYGSDDEYLLPQFIEFEGKIIQFKACTGIKYRTFYSPKPLKYVTGDFIDDNNNFIDVNNVILNFHFKVRVSDLEDRANSTTFCTIGDAMKTILNMTPKQFQAKSSEEKTSLIESVLEVPFLFTARTFTYNTGAVGLDIVGCRSIEEIPKQMTESPKIKTEFDQILADQNGIDLDFELDSEQQTMSEDDQELQSFLKDDPDMDVDEFCASEDSDS